jgi:hypothetical protein
MAGPECLRVRICWALPANWRKKSCVSASAQSVMITENKLMPSNFRITLIVLVLLSSKTKKMQGVLCLPLTNPMKLLLMLRMLKH